MLFFCSKKMVSGFCVRVILLSLLVFGQQHAEALSYRSGGSGNIKPYFNYDQPAADPSSDESAAMYGGSRDSYERGPSQNPKPATVHVSRPQAHTGPYTKQVGGYSLDGSVSSYKPVQVIRQNPQQPDPQSHAKEAGMWDTGIVSSQGIIMKAGPSKPRAESSYSPSKPQPQTYKQQQQQPYHQTLSEDFASRHGTVAHSGSKPQPQAYPSKPQTYPSNPRESNPRESYYSFYKPQSVPKQEGVAQTKAGMWDSALQRGYGDTGVIASSRGILRQSGSQPKPPPAYLPSKPRETSYQAHYPPNSKPQQSQAYPSKPQTYPSTPIKASWTSHKPQPQVFSPSKHLYPSNQPQAYSPSKPQYPSNKPQQPAYPSKTSLHLQADPSKPQMYPSKPREPSYQSHNPQQPKYHSGVLASSRGILIKSGSKPQLPAYPPKPQSQAYPDQQPRQPTYLSLTKEDSEDYGYPSLMQSGPKPQLPAYPPSKPQSQAYPSQSQRYSANPREQSYQSHKPQSQGYSTNPREPAYLAHKPQQQPNYQSLPPKENIASTHGIPMHSSSKPQQLPTPQINKPNGPSYARHLPQSVPKQEGVTQSKAAMWDSALSPGEVQPKGSKPIPMADFSHPRWRQQLVPVFKRN